MSVAQGHRNHERDHYRRRHETDSNRIRATAGTRVVAEPGVLTVAAVLGVLAGDVMRIAPFSVDSMVIMLGLARRGVRVDILAIVVAMSPRITLSITPEVTKIRLDRHAASIANLFVAAMVNRADTVIMPAMVDVCVARETLTPSVGVVPSGAVVAGAERSW